jgi:hypothetical protein
METVKEASPDAKRIEEIAAHVVESADRAAARNLADVPNILYYCFEDLKYLPREILSAVKKEVRKFYDL